jgi:hypothetical protein
MNALMLLACLTLLPQEERAPAGDVIRTYDLSGIAPGDYQHESEDKESLFPYFNPRFYGGNSEFWEEFEEPEADLIVEYLTSIYDDEFQYEGRFIDVGRRGRLTVRGPQALHARVERLLSFLDGVWNAQVELTVDVIEAPEGPAHDSGPAGVLVPASEVSAWIESARRRGAHHQYRMRLRADRPTTIDASRDRPVIMSYKSDVAQQSFAHRPFVAQASFGTRLSVHATPSKGGLLLALSLLRGDLIDGIRNRNLDVRGMLSTPDKVILQSSADLYQGFDVLNRSMTLNTFLPDDQALVVHTRVDVERSKATEVIVLRKTAGALPRMARLPLDETGRELLLANLGQFDPSRWVAWGSLIDPFYVPTRMRVAWDEYDCLPMIGTVLHQGELDFASEVVSDMGGGLDVTINGVWTGVFPQTGAFDDLEDMRAAQKLAQATVTDLGRSRALLDVSVDVRRPGGATPVHARLPLRSEDSCTLALGVESLELPTYDVEIAQGSTLATGIANSVFDGLALWLRPSLTPDGGLTLELRGGASLFAGGEQLDVGSRMFGSLDQSSHDHLFLKERIHFAAGDPKPWRVVLGNASDQGDEQALQIEVEVVVR